MGVWASKLSIVLIGCYPGPWFLMESDFIIVVVIAWGRHDNGDRHLRESDEVDAAILIPLLRRAALAKLAARDVQGAR